MVIGDTNDPPCKSSHHFTALQQEKQGWLAGWLLSGLVTAWDPCAGCSRPVVVVVVCCTWQQITHGRYSRTSLSDPVRTSARTLHHPLPTYSAKDSGELTTAGPEGFLIMEHLPTMEISSHFRRQETSGELPMLFSIVLRRDVSFPTCSHLRYF